MRLKSGLQRKGRRKGISSRVWGDRTDKKIFRDLVGRIRKCYANSHNFVVAWVILS